MIGNDIVEIFVSMPKSVLYLIDGSSQMYRAFHAPVRTSEGTLLRNAQGRPTNAVYIFVTMLRKLLKEHRPEYIAASFDLPGKTFRDELAADYKANRAPMPDELAEQIPMVHRACEALGVPILTHERYEADDVIGTIARRAVTEGYDVVIVTGDKDFYQLVDGGIRVFNPRDEGTWYDAAGVKEKFGVTPAEVVDVLALMGDAIDNVKGVPGIGEKGARDLISKWGTLDALLEHAAEVPHKKYREALGSHAAEALQSRQLLRIQTDVPVDIDFGKLRYQGPARDRCYEIFQELGFRSLAMEFAPTADTTMRDYRLVRSSDELAALVSELQSAGRLGLRVLTDQSSAVQARMIGLAFSVRPRSAWYVPLGHQELSGGEQLPESAVLAAMKPLLEDGQLLKVGHDVKFDTIVLARYGIELRGVDADVMVESYLLDATRSGHPLEDVALEHVGYKALTDEDVCGRGQKAVRFGELPAEAALDFAGERADLALQVADRLTPRLADAGLDALYRELELPLIPVLAAMERAGVRIDAQALAGQSRLLETELASLNTRIVELAGESFNLNSPKQLSEILFEKLKLPVLRRTGVTRSASTSVDVLEELALAHEMPRRVLEWRALQKLKSTYIDALPQLVDRETGRVHTCFNQAVAATGRLSSSEPNLQNIPIRTELGREIRRAFVADPGHVLISADYSQIELRVLAHLAQDEALIEAFRRGEDIHDRTALKVFGSESGLSPHELRRRAKVINYALLYGKTAFTLARDIGVTTEAAQAFVDAYFAGFPRVRVFIDRTLVEARTTGVVKTLYGRQRLVPELTSRDFQRRSAAERVAVNLPIQGTAADILKRAMINVHSALASRPGARMILTVHDELLFEVPRAAADEIAALVRDRMQSAAELSVPLTVDVGIGENWKDAKS
jgi:DNA polymerase I